MLREHFCATTFTQKKKTWAAWGLTKAWNTSMPSVENLLRSFYHKLCIIALLFLNSGRTFALQRFPIIWKLHLIEILSAL